MLLLPPGKKKVQRKLYQGTDAFRILGVKPNATTGEIKRAYRRLAFEFHPDRNLSPDARREFERINQAFAEIMNHGDLARLKLKCNAVEVKAIYADFLHAWKQTMVLTGIRVDVRKPGLDGVDKDLASKMMTLGTALFLRCPFCKWKEECNRATGFGEVEEIHHQIMRQKVG